MTPRTKKLANTITTKSTNTPDQVPFVRKMIVDSTSGAGATLKLNAHFVESASVIQTGILIIATGVAGTPGVGDVILVLNLPGALPLCIGKAY